MTQKALTSFDGSKYILNDLYNLDIIAVKIVLDL